MAAQVAGDEGRFHLAFFLKENGSQSIFSRFM